MLSAINIINYFGGVSHFADMIGVSRMCLYNWQKKGDEWLGVPLKFRKIILDYAVRNHIDFIESDFDSDERIKKIMQSALKKHRSSIGCVICVDNCKHPVSENKAPWFKFKGHVNEQCN